MVWLPKKLLRILAMIEVTQCRIDLWAVNTTNPQAPAFNGYVTLTVGQETVKVPVSIWANTNAQHPKAPALKGKISRPSPKLERPPLVEGVTVNIVENVPLPF
jgi:hypothetical protein